ncbi:MAG: hypothetical protein NTY09_05820 [bacterium]|nr:hypothetical protein [bacterium]
MLDKLFNNKESDNPLVGQKFYFKVPAHTKEAEDWKVEMELRTNGWYVTFGRIDGNCGKSGIPYLFRILEHSWIEVPYKLHSFIEHLWTLAINQKIDKDEIQNGFDNLSEWLKKVNREKPQGKVWEEVGA